MSMDNFLRYLQQLLTMVDPKNKASIGLAKTALSATYALARTAGKSPRVVLRSMNIAEVKFEYLVNFKDDFAGVPGEYQENEVKRQRLSHIIEPGC